MHSSPLVTEEGVLDAFLDSGPSQSWHYATVRQLRQVCGALRDAMDKHICSVKIECSDPPPARISNWLGHARMVNIHYDGPLAVLRCINRMVLPKTVELNLFGGKYGAELVWNERISPRALPELVSLFVADGCLESLAPFALLVGLQELTLDDCCHLHDLEAVSCLASLTSLSIFDCPSVTDISPLSRAGRLLHLDIDSCDGVTDVSPLSRLAQLRSLRINSCTLADASPLSCLALLTSLTVKAPILDLPLDACTGLMTVTVESPQLRSIVLAGHDQLTHMDVSGCELMSSVCLRGCTSLVTLDMVGLSSVSCLNALKACGALEALFLCDLPQVTSLGRALANLTRLGRLRMNRVGVTSLAAPVSLTELDVTSCKHLSSITFEGCARVRKLRLVGCTALSGSLAALSGLTSLETLCVRGCVGITSLDGLQGCALLRELRIRSTHVGTLAPLAGLDKLEVLDAMACEQLSFPEAFARLGELEVLGAEVPFRHRFTDKLKRRKYGLLRVTRSSVLQTIHVLVTPPPPAAVVSGA